MRPETWTLIEEKFKKHPVLKAEAVPYEESDAAATVAGITFPQDYREFIHRYGGAILGPLPIIGLRRSQAMADWPCLDFAGTCWVIARYG